MYLVILILIIYTILRYVISGSFTNLFILFLQSFSAAIIVLEDLKKILITRELYYSVIFICILLPAVILFHDAIFDEKPRKAKKAVKKEKGISSGIELNDIKDLYAPDVTAVFDKKLKIGFSIPYENAQKAYSANDLPAAKNIYETLMSINTKNPLLRYNYACVLYRIGEYEKALKVFLKTNSMLKNKRKKDMLSSSYYNTGCCLYHMNKYPQSSNCFKRALKYDPKDTGAIENMVLLKLKGPDLAEAKNIYRSLVRNVSMPFLFKICYITGTVYEKNKEYDKALLSYMEAKKIKREPFLMHKTAGLLYNINRIEDAIKEYEELCGLYPDDKKAYMGLGIAYFKKGDLINSRKFLQKTLDLRKGRYNYAFVLYAGGWYHEASEAIAPLLDDEARVDVQKLAGSIYMKLGRYYEAIKYYREALRSQPDNHRTMRDLGRAYAHIKDHHLSKEYFRSALALKDDDPDTVESLIRLCISSNDMENARRYISLYENLLKDSETGRTFLEYLKKEAATDAEYNT